VSKYIILTKYVVKRQLHLTNPFAFNYLISR